MIARAHASKLQRKQEAAPIGVKRTRSATAAGAGAPLAELPKNIKRRRAAAEKKPAVPTVGRKRGDASTAAPPSSSKRQKNIPAGTSSAAAAETPLGETPPPPPPPTPPPAPPPPCSCIRDKPGSQSEEPESDAEYWSDEDSGGEDVFLSQPSPGGKHAMPWVNSGSGCAASLCKKCKGQKVWTPFGKRRRKGWAYGPKLERRLADQHASGGEAIFGDEDGENALNPFSPTLSMVFGRESACKERKGGPRRARDSGAWFGALPPLSSLAEEGDQVKEKKEPPPLAHRVSAKVAVELETTDAGVSVQLRVWQLARAFERKAMFG